MDDDKARFGFPGRAFSCAQVIKQPVEDSLFQHLSLTDKIRHDGHCQPAHVLQCVIARWKILFETDSTDFQLRPLSEILPCSCLAFSAEGQQPTRSSARDLQMMWRTGLASS
jgi:hypothetical protein